MQFHDRRPKTEQPMPRTKAEVNGHLVNDHEFTQGGAGNSTRNLPTSAELKRQHDDLHAAGTAHVHPQPPVRGRDALWNHIHGPDHPEIVEASEGTASYLRDLHDLSHSSWSPPHSHQ